ncbi:hypothetical protein A8L34_05025 [Bacillus sp. FJAT-27264]|uniref:helix-turn-helix domain-containing protein n=1 Tax=Paenibacillus sp. (strain DSM 101736 / FJAT-27264) TaxID=1850362 RepID=UPI000808135C|nr:helix-turn-helix transcriptional regulator [Bacillus sp. FJAT-27264]OBZ18914.1 hypothetical protein A8L34_05025 [Bacillus sp. FJAT-27264]
MFTNFHNRLRLAREKAGLSQLQVMKRVGINNKTLSGYETGKSEPDINTIDLLCDLYSVSSDWLLGRTDIKNIYNDNNKQVSINLSDDSFASEEVIFNEKALVDSQKRRLLKLMRLFLED